MSWYSRGSSGLDQEKKRRQASEKPDRFWLPKDSTKEIVVLDNESFNVTEYTLKLLEGGFAQVTKPENVDCDVLFRQAGLRPSFKALYTVVDCTPWTDNKGAEHNYKLCILALTPRGAEMMEKRRASLEKDGLSLSGAFFEVTRFDADKALAAGDDYQYKRHADLSKVFDVANYRGKSFADLLRKSCEDSEVLSRMQSKFALDMKDGKPVLKLVPFNYLEICKPPSMEEAKLLLGTAALKSGGGYGSNSLDDIPF